MDKESSENSAFSDNFWYSGEDANLYWDNHISPVKVFQNKNLFYEYFRIQGNSLHSD